MWLLLACVPHEAPPVAVEAAVVYPVDPAFTGDVRLDGATVVYYPVVGKDDIEAFGVLRRDGPHVGASVHGASTVWDVRWTWPDGGACAPVRVTADIVVTFPRWEPPADAPANSVGNWQRYVRALATHEQGHVDRIRGVTAQIPGVLEAAGCDGIAAKGAEALALLAELNAAYDVETGSGAAQGAVLFVPRGR